MPQPPALDELNSALDDVMPADRVALRARLAGLRRRVQKGQPVDRGLPALAADAQAGPTAEVLAEVDDIDVGFRFADRDGRQRRDDAARLDDLRGQPIAGRSR